MDIVTLLLIIVVLIIILNFKSDVSDKLNGLQNRIQELNEKISKQPIIEQPVSQPKSISIEAKPIVSPPPVMPEPKTEYWESSFKVEEETSNKDKEEPILKCPLSNHPSLKGILIGKNSLGKT